MTLLLLTAVVERLLVPVDAGLGVMLRAMDRRMQPIYVHVLHFSMVFSQLKSLYTT